MTNLDQCPFCSSREVFTGRIKCSERFTFLPHAIRTSIWRVVTDAGIEFGPSANLCVQCGRIWSRAKPQKARDFFESYGDEAAQAKIKNATTDPPPDYPPPRLPTI